MREEKRWKEGSEDWHSENPLAFKTRHTNDIGYRGRNIKINGMDSSAVCVEAYYIASLTLFLDMRSMRVSITNYDVDIEE